MSYTTTRYTSVILVTLVLQVRLWLTFNEPWVFCWQGYGSGSKAPGKKDKPGEDPYKCAHNVLKSHAKAWHTYDSKYRAAQNGYLISNINPDYLCFEFDNILVRHCCSTCFLSKARC